MTPNKDIPDEDIDELPEIPFRVIDRYGHVVELTGSKIRLHDPVNSHILDLDRVPEGEIQHAIKFRIAWAIGNYAPHSVRSEFYEVVSLLQKVGMPSDFTQMDLTWWNGLRQLLRSESREPMLGRFRLWFLWLFDQGFPGLDPEAADIIETWSIPGGVKGEAIRSQDESKGPLTWRQFAHLVTRIGNIARDEISPQVAAVQLCINLGLNARNIALLEERDISYIVDPATGDKDYFLEVPRIKKRLSVRETKRRHIEPETGGILEALISKNRQRRGNVAWEQPGKMPIFSRFSPREFPDRSPLRSRFEWHCSSGMIYELVAKFSIENELRAPGEEERFYLYPRRLRYTFGTMLAATGAPPRAIAEALDHTDLQHVGVYVESIGMLADRLNSAIGRHLEPWVKRFIFGPPDDLAKGRPDTIYSADPSQSLGIGYCGHSARCGWFPPDSCYGCDFFEPWGDADHASVLRGLERRKASLVINSGSESDRIPHQLNEVIENVKILIAAQARAKENHSEPA